MMLKETHILTLRSSLGRAHKVVQWGDYGIVVPTLWTTNGNIAFTAQQIWEALSSYTLEDSALPATAFQSQEALTETLRNFYREHRED
jgi:hypothetical protein